MLKLQSYVDNELDASAAATVLSHVTACEKCRTSLAEAESLSRSLRKNLTRHELPAGLSEKITATIRHEAAVGTVARSNEG